MGKHNGAWPILFSEEPLYLVGVFARLAFLLSSPEGTCGALQAAGACPTRIRYPRINECYRDFSTATSQNN